MMDTVWRLAWALPLVLVVGTVAALMLKRFALPAGPAPGRKRRMELRESLSLSNGTRVHLIEVDGRDYLIVESARQTLLQTPLRKIEVSADAKPTGRNSVEPLYRDLPL